jgi:hypothetical protein
MLVKEFYSDCLRFEETVLAHYMYYLLEERKISLDDNMDDIEYEQVDHQKVKELIERNVLGIRKVRIYSLKMNEEDFYFIFALSKQEAIQFYTKTFHHTPLNCHEYSLDFQLDRGNEAISFREMRRNFKSFPAIAGWYKRER